MPRKSGQEWAIIENEYTTMPVTFADLSKKYDLSVNSISVRSIKGRWDLKRKSFMENTCMKIQGSKAKEKLTSDYNLINQLEKLIKVKTQAELDSILKYYKLTDDGKTLSPRDLMGLINKSKDGASELIKVVELLKGNPTDRYDMPADERQERLLRLRQRSGILQSDN